MDTVMDTVMVISNVLNLFSNSEFKNPLTVDLHSHLLPGIDDGVRTLKESLAIIKKFKSLGYTKLITTPHIISDSYTNTQEIIQEKLSVVQEALKKEQINITIEAGAEHYINMDFLELLKEDKVVPFCNKYLLFETSYTTKPFILEEAVFEMKVKGYTPVLAHPERYRYVHDDIEAYKALKDLGVLFQMNIKSLKKSSGSVYKTALKLMNLGLIDFIGSDAHRMRDMVDLEKIIMSKRYETIFKKNSPVRDSIVDQLKQIVSYATLADQYDFAKEIIDVIERNHISGMEE